MSGKRGTAYRALPAASPFRHQRLLLEHSHERFVFGVFKAAEVNVHHGLLVGLKPCFIIIEANSPKKIKRFILKSCKHSSLHVSMLRFSHHNAKCDKKQERNDFAFALARAIIDIIQSEDEIDMNFNLIDINTKNIINLD